MVSKTIDHTGHRRHEEPSYREGTGIAGGTKEAWSRERPTCSLSSDLHGSTQALHSRKPCLPDHLAHKKALPDYLVQPMATL